MSLATVAAFWGVSLLFVLTPGADWAYAIAAGLHERSTTAAVGGLLLGHLAATGAVAAGVAALVAQSPRLLTGLTALGAAYLLWLGAALVRTSASAQVSQGAADVSAGGSSWTRQLARGAGVSALNPKVLLLFLALLPQFTDPDGAWPVAVQTLVLGLAHIMSCAVVYVTVAVAARRVLRARPVAARIVTRLSGTAMVVLAAALLVEQVLD